MRIYNYDLHGFFICESLADESPLEPGAFLIPAYATSVEPPEVGEGSRAKWTGEEWTVEAEELPPVKTFQKALASLNTTYQGDLLKLNNAYAMAALMDGPTEATKQAAIRSQYATRKSAHTEAVAALKLEYGV